MRNHTPESYRENFNTAKISGQVRHYDAMSQDRNAYDKKLYVYIGMGTIHSVNGVIQNKGGKYDQETAHFFVRRGRKGETREEIAKREQVDARARLGVGSKGFSYKR